jgi:hypothetical protein
VPRIKLRKGLQSELILSIKDDLNFSWSQLSKKLKVHPRSLSDWYREKYTLPESVFKRIIKITGNKEIAHAAKVLPEYWILGKVAREGGLARLKKHGSPGTLRGRKKGGANSQIQRRLHPERYKNCSLRKEISRPGNCAELAELFGAILGDGGINNDHQVVITLNRHNDRRYAEFICKLAGKLFSMAPKIYERKGLGKENIIDVVIGGINIVEFLLSKGLLKGGKVKHQIDVPHWIKENEEFSTYCLRGLIDTDGGVFYHRHTIGQGSFLNIGLQFSNHSKPLLKFAEKTLFTLGYTPKIASHYVNLYKKDEILRYAEEIRFHNPYHKNRVKKFVDLKKVFSRRDA